METENPVETEKPKRERKKRGPRVRDDRKVPKVHLYFRHLMARKEAQTGKSYGLMDLKRDAGISKHLAYLADKRTLKEVTFEDLGRIATVFGVRPGDLILTEEEIEELKKNA